MYSLISPTKKDVIQWFFSSKKIATPTIWEVLNKKLYQISILPLPLKKNNCFNSS